MWLRATKRMARVFYTLAFGALIENTSRHLRRALDIVPTRCNTIDRGSNNAPASLSPILSLKSAVVLVTALAIFSSRL